MKTKINKEVFEELLKLAEEVARFNVEYDKEIFFSHSPHVKHLVLRVCQSYYI